jgi:hypothetical protein
MLELEYLFYRRKKYEIEIKILCISQSLLFEMRS